MDDQLLPAVQKAYDVNVWVLPFVTHLPRTYKFTLGTRIQNTALDINLALVEAAHAKGKRQSLYRANRLLDQLRILLRLARDLNVLSIRQYEFVSALNEELGRMIGGWSAWAGARARTAARGRDS